MNHPAPQIRLVDAINGMPDIFQELRQLAQIDPVRFNGMATESLFKLQII